MINVTVQIAQHPDYIVIRDNIILGCRANRPTEWTQGDGISMAILRNEFRNSVREMLFANMLYGNLDESGKSYSVKELAEFLTEEEDSFLRDQIIWYDMEGYEGTFEEYVAEYEPIFGYDWLTSEEQERGVLFSDIYGLDRE